MVNMMGSEQRLSVLSSWLLLVIAAAVAAAVDIPSLSSYQNRLAVDPKYEIYWTADTAAARPKASFAVRAATKGFVAFGISEVGGMVGTGTPLEAHPSTLRPSGGRRAITLTEPFVDRLS